MSFCPSQMNLKHGINIVIPPRVNKKDHDQTLRLALEALERDARRQEPEKENFTAEK